MTAQHEALIRLATANDFEVYQLLHAFHDLVLGSLPEGQTALQIGLPPELVSDGATDPKSIIASRHDQPVETTNPRGATRQLLLLVAQDAQLAPLLLHAFDEVRDDRQLIGEVLAIGTVGAVWIVLAGLEFELNTPLGPVRKSCDPKTIDALANLARALWGHPTGK